MSSLNTTLFTTYLCFLVELYNSQALLRGCESPGYVIVSAAKASLLACDHRPVWRDRQIRSKSTLVGTIDCMQVILIILYKQINGLHCFKVHIPVSDLPTTTYFTFVILGTVH